MSFPSLLPFAVTGVGGGVATRHLTAIAHAGGQVVAALDPNDSVGVLDRYGLDVAFFTDTERFDRHLQNLRTGPEGSRVRWLSICSPNHLHAAQCRLGLRADADVICEKPVVVDPRELDALAELEDATQHRIWTVLQLRTHNRLVALREQIRLASSRRYDVELTYITPRGRWYDVSWKGDAQKSGGIATNIGVHMFDLLVWLFGSPVGHGVHLHEPRRMAGRLELELASVTWFLSVDARDHPVTRSRSRETYRAITIDGAEIEFSTGFADLHTRVYEETLAGRGFGLDDARASIELAHRIRHASVERRRSLVHSLLS
jgi:UDP-N-acetyl-2-amino-2-deoxyglucuronate dehydrogenase